MEEAPSFSAAGEAGFQPMEEATKGISEELEDTDCSGLESAPSSPCMLTRSSVHDSTFQSHSNFSPIIIQGVLPNIQGGKTWALDEVQIQKTEPSSMSVCQQQLPQCNMVTAVCAGVHNGEEGVQVRRSGCVCVSPVKTELNIQSEADVHLSPISELSVCCGSSIHPASTEDTIAPYRHPGSIPSSQLLPRLVPPSCNMQHFVAPSPATNHLPLPRLISSVSETGLDAKHLLRCCNLSCSWISAAPPGTVPQSSQYIHSPSTPGHKITRDVGTMTTHHSLREVGVQTSHAARSHVFPEICMAEESSSETSNTKTVKSDSRKGKKSGAAPKEVKWDAEGMTWEVYGASVDPEELGLAIQKHLELQIKETATRAAKLSRENTSTSQQTGHQRKRSRMMSSLCVQGCCSGSASNVD